MHRRVGAVVDGVFHKDRVQGSRHFLRRPPGIALDAESLRQAEAAGATSVSITDQETGITYTAAFETIREHGIHVDRGLGIQVGLEFQWWNTGKRVDLNIRQLALGL
jgi:hypothetical protein